VSTIHIQTPTSFSVFLAEALEALLQALLLLELQLVPLLLQLPPRLVVAAIMQKLAVV
jgi:hypothetical protein